MAAVMKDLSAAALLSVLLIPVACVASDHACAPGPKDLACIGVNFNGMYERSNEQFWSILHARAEEVLACKSEDTVGSFLELVRHSGNAEFAEFYAETVETLAVTNPRCVAAAWSKLPRESQARVVQSLKAPLFKTTDEIAAAARKSKVPEKFPELAIAMGW